MALDKQLRTSWGEQYEAKMSAVLGLLEQHEELDTALYESGSWGDFWTLDTLSRVALKEF